MNDTIDLHSTPNYANTQLADRILSIYSLILILIGTPCNLLCCLIYFQKANRKNSIKTIFGYLAVLDTIVLYTFNLNYVVREFNIDYHITYNAETSINDSNKHLDIRDDININIYINITKKNLEEHSLFVCRFLSYLAFSILQTASWVLAFGSLNRYLLISKLTSFEFICKRSYTIGICFFITCSFFLTNMHMLWMNGYLSPEGNVVCYDNKDYPNYMKWYQPVHLCLYSALPSIVLFILNTLLMRIIFASKKRLDTHTKVVLFTGTSTVASKRQRNFVLRRFSSLSSSKLSTKHNSRRSLNRHGRKLTLSLIFITLSFFILTFPSTVIFSFFRSYIKSSTLRRTLSHLFTNLSTTTHVIRFFIYFFCSVDFRNDFYSLFSFKQSLRSQLSQSQQHHHQQQNTQNNERQTNSLILHNKNEIDD